MSASRQPAIFVPHGGGPCFWIEFPPPFGPNAWDRLRDYLSGLVASLPERPKAFLVVTAHWEAPEPTVSVNPRPGMLFDYYGFPEHTYKLSYPAPGEPELAAEVERLIEAAGLPVGPESAASTTACSCLPARRPEADIPVVMLSLRRSRSRFPHQVGKALAPLRDRASRSSAAA